MNTETSIGPEGAGGNENHGNEERRNRTLGEAVKQEPPAGAPFGDVLDDAGAEMPAGVPGAREQVSRDR